MQRAQTIPRISDPSSSGRQGGRLHRRAMLMRLCDRDVSGSTTITSSRIAVASRWVLFLSSCAHTRTLARAQTRTPARSLARTHAHPHGHFISRPRTFHRPTHLPQIHAHAPSTEESRPLINVSLRTHPRSPSVQAPAVVKEIFFTLALVANRLEMRGSRSVPCIPWNTCWTTILHFLRASDFPAFESRRAAETWILREPLLVAAR
jgi:hypothetical protein